MWLALKLLASGAFKGALRGLSAAADWLLAEWWRAPLILFAAGFAVVAFIRVPALQREIDRARADLAAEFLQRNRTYRAEHEQMQQRIADGAVAKNAAETAFARRWGLSFRHGAG